MTISDSASSDAILFAAILLIGLVLPVAIASFIEIRDMRRGREWQR